MKAISSAARDRIVRNNRKISELLKENENLLREEGVKAPLDNYVVEKDEMIQIPSGYIRMVNEIIQQFHLNEIFRNSVTRKNVTYALELSDLHNYIFNRIGIWGPILTITYKLAIVNIASIIEAVVLEVANNVCYTPSTCKNANGCKLHLTKNERNYFSPALKKLISLEVYDLDDAMLQDIESIFSSRNNIHIRLSQKNELLDNTYNMSLYNKAILILRTIMQQSYERGCSLYFCGNNPSIAE